MIHMRRARACWITCIVGLAVALCAQPAFADPCSGSHYEYDHGECFDQSGNTTSTMLEMYSASDRLQQGILDRGRTFAPPVTAGAWANGSTQAGGSYHDRLIALGVASVRLLQFHPSANPASIDDFARTLPAKYRKRGRTVLRSILSDYRTLAAAEGLSPSSQRAPFSRSSARISCTTEIAGAHPILHPRNSSKPRKPNSNG